MPQGLQEDWEELRKLLLEKSYREGKIILTSGKESDFYVDCRETTLHGRGAALTGRIFFERIKGSGAQAVGGPTLGADPMVTAIAMTAAAAGEELPAFIIRKESKGHGTGKLIEGIGNIPAGARVAIVEDAVTTGGSTYRSIEAARGAGFEVVKVVCLVDREEGGKENLAEKGITLESIFTRTSLLSGIPA
ncbi:MAG: orotate phosphoribosyltransferase [bacterium]|nr:orotate phosphoribosyltransferase [bacterium]